jgi:hypothetical protein
VEFFWDFAWHAAQLFLLVGIVAGVYFLARQPRVQSILLRAVQSMLLRPVLFILQPPRRLARRAFLALHEHFVLRAIFREEVITAVRRLIGHLPRP